MEAQFLFQFGQPLKRVKKNEKKEKRGTCVEGVIPSSYKSMPIYLKRDLSRGKVRGGMTLPGGGGAAGRASQHS